MLFLGGFIALVGLGAIANGLWSRSLDRPPARLRRMGVVVAGVGVISMGIWLSLEPRPTDAPWFYRPLEAALPTFCIMCMVGCLVLTLMVMSHRQS
jgi:hypothetical protein